MFSELITEILQDGYKVSFSAPGHSMFPTIMANETIVVEPIDPSDVRMRDIVLYRANGSLVAHRVVHIEKKLNGAKTTSPFILRGDAAAACDEPVKAEQILGKVISIERNDCNVDPYSRRAQLICLVRVWTSRLKRFLIQPRIFISAKEND